MGFAVKATVTALATRERTSDSRASAAPVASKNEGASPLFSCIDKSSNKPNKGTLEMLLKTILNRVEKHPLFVYKNDRLVEDDKGLSIEVTVEPRANSRPICRAVDNDVRDTTDYRKDDLVLFHFGESRYFFSIECGEWTVRAVALWSRAYHGLMASIGSRQATSGF